VVEPPPPPVAPPPAPEQPPPLQINPIGPSTGQPETKGFTVDLGTVPVGSVSAPVPVTVSGPELAAGVRSIKVGPGFAVVADTCTGHQLPAPTATCTFGLVFRPTTPGPAHTQIAVTMTHLCTDGVAICNPPTSDIRQNGNYHYVIVRPVVIIQWTEPMAVDGRGLVNVAGTGSVA
jgi:hypothetical protein